MTIQIKILETGYTPQDLETAATYGAEGFGHVTDLDDSENYAFTKVQIDDDVVDELKKLINEGYSVGDTFEVDGVEYQIS